MPGKNENNLNFLMLDFLSEKTLPKGKDSWHAPTKDTTSYVRVKDILASGTGGWYPRAPHIKRCANFCA